MNTESRTPHPPSEQTRRHIETTRRVAVTCLLALIALGLAWELWLAPLRPGGSWWAIKVIPLTIPLAGLLKNRLYTYRWVSLLIWLYFTEGVIRLTTESGWSAWLAGGQTVLCLVLFTVSALHVRIRLKAAGTEAVRADAAEHARLTGAAADPTPAKE
ncbi:MAG: hypothetical protein RL297_1409 [Pseudomonadota bacterium]